MTVNIREISVETALEMALRSEIDAEKVYEKLHRMIGNFVLKEKIKFLMEEEKRHQDVIREVYSKLFQSQKIKNQEKGILPKLSIGLNEEGSVIDLLELAVEAEQISEEFYDALSLEVENRKISEIFQYLSRMEHGHYSLLKGELDLCINDETYYEQDGFHYDMVHVGP